MLISNFSSLCPTSTFLAGGLDPASALASDGFQTAPRRIKCVLKPELTGADFALTMESTFPGVNSALRWENPASGIEEAVRAE